MNSLRVIYFFDHKYYNYYRVHIINVVGNVDFSENYDNCNVIKTPITHLQE